MPTLVLLLARASRLSVGKGRLDSPCRICKWYAHVFWGPEILNHGGNEMTKCNQRRLCLEGQNMFFFPFKPRRKSWVETAASLTQVPVDKCLSHIWRVGREKAAVTLLLLGLHETMSQQRKDFRSSSSLGQAYTSFWWTGNCEETGEKLSRSQQWWLEW